MTIDDHIPNTAKPTKPHPDDVAVDNFAVVMKEKLAIARGKGRSGWEECDPAHLSAMLYEHVAKGDPRDVANFCMFLWNFGQPITQYHKTPAVAQIWEPDEKACKFLADMITADPDQITRVGFHLGYAKDDEGNLVHGFSVYEAEYPEEGVHTLVETNPAPAVAQEPILQRVMGRLADLLDEDQFAEIEGMVVRAGIAPPPTPTPSVAVNKTLLEAAKRAINYSKNVLKAEGVSFDDDEDLPFIVAAINQAEPVPDLPPEWIDEEATP